MFDFTYHLEPMDGDSVDELRLAIEAIEAIRSDGLRAAKAYHQGMERLRAEYREQLHSIAGERLEEFQDRHRKRMERMRAMRLELPPTVEGLAKRKRLTRMAVRNAKKAIEASGVDISGVMPLQEEYQEKGG